MDTYMIVEFRNGDEVENVKEIILAKDDGGNFYYILGISGELNIAVLPRSIKRIYPIHKEK